MSGSKFGNLAKMASNLMTSSMSMRPLATSAVARFPNGIPPDQDSLQKTNTKTEEKEKDSVIINDTKKAKVFTYKYTDESLDRIYGPNNWKMDSENPKKIYYSYTTPEGKWETTWGELEGIYLGKGNAKGTG